ncbi:hypothetical protein TESG_07317 [Trichophyton tonsurans CBS 112818]|uniref:Tse2 ADP-ribosyltransferase toxin domain-containing protein n=1 Tax=Trichophyton tonsurans (strain CBS 112818) TaxID=647933 RepID=F2S8U0_TRIT1|nr:hypothetical protein TESG_07317 [Trichophyton tonsurans CBS 112818]
MAMFRTTVINPLIKGKPVFNARRHFTVTSIHDSFPATLYRFQIHRDSRLYDKELKKGNEDLEFADGVEISKDGLVYPGITNILSNGAVFMPNTRWMQQQTRMSYDYFLEDMADRQPPDAFPHFLCIPKGTVIPKSLMLLRGRNIRCEFSLMPSSPMKLKELNDTLMEFYLKHGTATPADEWLGSHGYAESFDESTDDYMRY